MHDFAQREMSVLTPEQVRLEYETAGIGSRAGAHIIDWLLLGAFYAIIFTALAETTSLFSKGYLVLAKEYVGGLAIILFYLIQYSYFVCTEFYMGGKTFGKKWIGIRVIQDNGQALTMLSSLIRNFFRIIDGLPLFYSLGIAVSFFHPKDKRIGDLLAGTVVIIDIKRDRHKKQRRIVKTIAKSKDDSIELTISEAQKTKLTREDWLMLATFMERLPHLTKKKRAEISDQMAIHLLRKMSFADEELYKKVSTSFLIAVYQQLKEEWEF
ncbi:MAG: hypothetical protein JWM44_2270 [Bacilli bacterium]|nr:hypothetical protein [Bacilli bacterium]